MPSLLGTMSCRFSSLDGKRLLVVWKRSGHTEFIPPPSATPPKNEILARANKNEKIFQIIFVCYKYDSSLES